MTVQAKYEFKVDVEEYVALDLEHASDPEVVERIGADAETLTGTTTPAVSKSWAGRVTLSGGAASLDLTALSRGNLPNVDFTGLKVQLIKLKTPNTNTVSILVAKASSNGYNLFGPTNATADRLLVVPGALMQLFTDDEYEDVDATHKAIDFTGTGTETIDVQLVAG